MLSVEELNAARVVAAVGVEESEELVAVLSECELTLKAISVRPGGLVVSVAGSFPSVGGTERRKVVANYFCFAELSDNIAAAVRWCRDLVRKGGR